MSEIGAWNEEKYHLILGRAPWGLNSEIQIGDVEYQPGLLQNTQHCVTWYICVAYGPGPCKIGYGALIYPNINDNIYLGSYPGSNKARHPFPLLQRFGA